MNYKKIGEFICQLRKEKDMTQKELADKLHITEQAVSKWERGLGCPDISLFKPLSKILDASINELMNGEKINDENVKEKADKAILNALDHSHNVVRKKNKQILLTIIGVLIVIYGYNTQGFVDDYVSVFCFRIYSIQDIIMDAIIVLGFIAGIVGIILGLMSKNKRQIILIVCLLLFVVGLNIINYYSIYYSSSIELYNIISNIFNPIIMAIGISITVIGIMLGKNKFKIVTAIVTTIGIVLLIGYIIDSLTFSNMKMGFKNKHYEYSEILKEAGRIKDVKNKEVVDGVVNVVKLLEKQQQKVDKLNGKKISIDEGFSFVNGYDNYLDMNQLRDSYIKNISDNDGVAEDLFYAMRNNGNSSMAYYYCIEHSEDSVLFPKPVIILSCSPLLQSYYELQHANSMKVLEEVLERVR